MKVLHVITTLTVGGAESALARIVEAAASRGVESRVAALRAYGATAERLSAAGHTVEDLGMRPSRPTARGFARLIRLIREFEPDVIQTWMYHADLAGSLANLLAGRRPMVWNIRHSNFGDEDLKPVTRLTVRACALLSNRLPDRIVCCSNKGATIHVRRGYPPERIAVIPNGFDLQRFRPDAEARASVRLEFGIPEDAPVIGLAARLHPQKDHATFFDAAAMIATKSPDAWFLLCGNGINEANPAVRDLAVRAGVAERTCLVGLRADMSRVMAAMDVYVSSSAFGEGFSNVIGEAMAVGVPAVVTDVGDSALLVGDTGAVVPPRQSAPLAAHVLELLELPASARQERSRRARERIAREFSIDSVLDRYLETWSAVAGAPPRKPVVSERGARGSAW